MSITPTIEVTPSAKFNYDAILPLSKSIKYNEAYLIPKFKKVKEVNPFNHALRPRLQDILKIFVMSLTLAPVRLFCIITLLSIGWVIAKVGLIGITQEDCNKSPFSGWRHELQMVLRKIFRLVFFSMGFHRIKVTGHQASRESAPILVSAPHSTIVDSIAIMISQSVPVAKQGMSEVIFMGAIGRLLQVLFVSREAASSRKDTINQIKGRALDQPQLTTGIDGTDEEASVFCCPKSHSVPPKTWPQLFIFPEGTCTNAKALITFKQGAFLAGCPVQPVLIRRDNKGLDTLTWTWEQKYGGLACLWLTLCQLRTHFEVEFLSVYNPSKDERDDAKLFASNVRARMALRLGIPTVERDVSEFLVKSEKSVHQAREVVSEEVPSPRIIDFVGNLTHT